MGPEGRRQPLLVVLQAGEGAVGVGEGGVVVGGVGGRGVAGEEGVLQQPGAGGQRDGGRCGERNRQG